MSGLKRRTRGELYRFGRGSLDGFDVFNGRTFPLGISTGELTPVKESQITDSEGHPFHSRSKGAVGDIGGDFFTQRSYVATGNGSRMLRKRAFDNGVDKYRIFSGPIVAVNPSLVGFPAPGHSGDTEMNRRGATAIARSKPTNSVANVATAVGEIYKDGLPALVGHSTWSGRTAAARNAGSEFLNVEFGWLPLISDVKSFSSAVRRAPAVLKQYERDAGKVVRRRYNFPIEKTKSSQSYGTNMRPAYTPTTVFFDDLVFGDVELKVETFRHQWFSGAFTYSLPSGYDSRNALDRYALMADKVFGASLTPDTLWNLAPWSWAVDWFSNTGDVISNISDWISDGLVLHYGYMMEHTIVKHTYNHVVTVNKPGSNVASPLTMVTETKVRRRANPFGFGVSWDGLSPIQTAIVAALGLSRT